MNVFESQLPLLFAAGREVPQALDDALYILAVTNFLMNPVIYCSFQRRYRNAVLALPGFRFVNCMLFDECEV